ncbi:hypothetical protein H0Z60_18560 [Ectothiorhodospiraceae bacterium WFHF3C12]|nr:hypothetical protein [Ectothiorhodospiraceae bacterium WFHF3C12]
MNMGNVALLAPVPLAHLTDGAVVCRTVGKVAFGSRAWEVFRELDQLQPEGPVDVLIYASHANADGPAKVAWRAEYIGYVEGRHGAHPEGMMYRPPSTAEHSSDNFGHWAVFWEVKNLRELAPAETIAVRELQNLTGKYYKPSFVPEGPIIVQSPW